MCIRNSSKYQLTITYKNTFSYWLIQVLPLIWQQSQWKTAHRQQIWVNSENDSTVGTWKQMWCDYCVSHLLELQHIFHISLKTEPHSQCLCPSFIYSLWSFQSDLILLHIWFVCPCGLSSLITVDFFSFWSAAASDPSGLHHVSVFTNPTLHP